jgi:GDP-4-dehydro-6-deoxy-D-mannose reductase
MKSAIRNPHEIRIGHEMRIAHESALRMKSAIRNPQSAILITGAAGFAGSHLIELLAADGNDVIGWHRPGGSAPAVLAGAHWEAVDLLDPIAVRAAIERGRPSTVYHCAGAAHVGRAWNSTTQTFEVNVRGTHHLLEALAAAGLSSVVLIPSSAMIYRPQEDPLDEDAPVLPPNPYGLSKLAQERLASLAMADGLDVRVGRAFNHVGPRQDPSFAASGFAKQIAEIEAGRRQAEIVVGNLEARREATDVRDTVRAYRAIVEHGKKGRHYNVSSGRAYAIGDILERLLAKARVGVQVRVDPSRLRPNDVPVLVGDPARLRDELGWTPQIPLERTLTDVLEYWRDQTR